MLAYLPAVDVPNVEPMAVDRPECRPLAVRPAPAWIRRHRDELRRAAAKRDNTERAFRRTSPGRMAFMF